MQTGGAISFCHPSPRGDVGSVGERPCRTDNYLCHQRLTGPPEDATREAAVAASIKNANIDRAIRRGVFNRYSVTPISFDQLVLLYVGDADRMKPLLDWFS